MWSLPALLLALATAGHAAEAKSTIRLCNAGNTAIALMTIGDAAGGGWVIDGWQPVAMGECHAFDLIFNLKIGVAVVKAGRLRGMQVYDPSLAADLQPGPVSPDNAYCVSPNRNFRRSERTLQQLQDCKEGEALARIAFNIRLWPNETATIQIPSDGNGEIAHFRFPAPAFSSFPPFKPNDRSPLPNAVFALAMKGLAEQQERLGFRIAQREPEPNAAWSAYYLRDLGVVVRPVTHAVSVAKGSPAGKAGILPGSEIVRIGDVVLQSAWHARGLLTRTRPGDIRTVTFQQNGVFRTARITLAPLPPALAATELHPNQGWLGVEFESAARVLATIYQDGRPHLELGDDIIKIDRSDFDGVDGLARWFARNADGTTVELQVRRRGQFMVMALEKLR